VATTRSDAALVDDAGRLNAGLSADDSDALARAYDFAAALYSDRLLGTGEPAFEHAVGLARIAVELRLDADARAAGLLFAAPAYLPEAEERLGAALGPVVAKLVTGIGKLNQLRVVTRTAAPGKESGAQAEALSKMLLAMVEDIRVVLLRLASRTQTLRWLARAPEAERRPLAR